MRELVEGLFGRFPREAAFPQRRPVEDANELLALIDKHNGLTDCFVSAYAFAGGQRSYADVVINKVVFDFDGEWGRLVDAHEWLEERGAAHFVVFSGSDESGHLYVLTEPTRHQQSLELFQRDVVIDGVGLRRCSECGGRADRVDPTAVVSWECGTCGSRLSPGDTDLAVDSNLVGDPATCVRVPNTWHPRAERFCVPLKPGEIRRDPTPAYEAARSQRDLALSDIVCGERPVDITQRKGEAEERYRAYEERGELVGFESDQDVLEGFEAEVSPVDMLNSIECECVRRLFLDEDGHRTEPPLGHEQRRVLISYLVEEGFNPAEINKFLRFAIADDKARHSVVEEEQPTRIWRDGVKAPNSVTLKRMGLFRQDCPEHAKVAAEVEA